MAADLEEAAALALRAGVDIDLMGNAYAGGLPGALERGLVPWPMSMLRSEGSYAEGSARALR